jgi:hypothetical protein
VRYSDNTNFILLLRNEIEKLEMILDIKGDLKLLLNVD